VPQRPRVHPSSAQATSDLVRDLISDFPGVIVSVTNTPETAYLRLVRHGVTWDVTIERKE